MAVTQAQVAQLYVALFNRAPEGAGFNAWVASGADKTQAQLAQLMLESPAAKAYYGNSVDTDRGYIETIYKNILGKDYSQDPNGIDSWVLHLQLGHTRGETLVKLFEVAQSAIARAADPVAAKVFENKTEISAYMAQKIGSIETDSNGNYDYAMFQEIIATTTATNLAAQKAKIDEMANSTTHTATTSDETLTGNSCTDIFNATVSSFADRNTLNVNDKIDGGAGKDMLNVTVNDSFTGFVDGYVKNVESLNLTNSSNAQRVFNAAKVEGLKSVSTHGADGIRITDLANIVDLTVVDQKDTTKVGIAYNTNLTDGESDTQNLTLNNVGRETAVAEATPTDRHVKSLKVEFNGIENLNITTRENKSYIKEVENKVITVNGEADLNIATKDKDTSPGSTDFVKSLDASAMTGNLVADLSGSRKYSSVKSGNGNDTIVVGQLTTNSASIDAGAGEDTLQVRSISGLKKMTLSGLENIEIMDKNAGGVSRLDFVGQNDIRTLKVGQLDNELVVTSSSIETVNLTDKVSPYAADDIGLGSGKVHVNDTSVKTVNYKIDNATSPTAMIGKIRLSESKNVTVNLDASVITQAATSTVELPKANTLNLNVNTTVDSGIKLANSTQLKTLNVVSTNPNKFTLDTDATATTNTNQINKLNVTTAGSFEISNPNTLAFVSDINIKGNGPMLVGSLVDLKNLGSISSENGVSLKVNDLVTASLGGVNVIALKVGDIVTKVDNNAGANVNLKNITNGIEVNKIDVSGEVTFAANNIGGLKIVDAIISKKSSITFDVSGVRHDVKLGGGTTGMEAKNDVNISIKNVEGKLDITKIKAQNVTINATNIKNVYDTEATSKTINVGEINENVKSLKVTLKDILNSGGTGFEIGKIALKENSSVVIDAGNTRGLVKIGTPPTTIPPTPPTNVKADSVSIDLHDTIGANVITGIEADTVVYKGSVQTPLSSDVKLFAKQDANSKDFTATVTTSAQDDVLDVTVAAKVATVGKDLKTVTVSGDMGEGLLDEYKFNGTNAAELTKIDFSGLTNVEKGTITTVAANTKIESIKGTAGNDTITLANGQTAENVVIETGEGENKVITGTVLNSGKHTITINGGSGNDTFDVSASTITGGFDGSNPNNIQMTVINNLNVGDKIKIAAAVATPGRIEDSGKVYLNANGVAQNNFAKAAVEGGFFTGTGHNVANTVYAYSYMGDTYLVYNSAASDSSFTAGDNIVKLSGVNLSSLKADIAADGTLTINQI